MTILITNCPRCGAVKTTFDALAQNLIGVEYGWQMFYEVFCVCRGCEKGSVFVINLSVDSPNKDVFKGKKDIIAQNLTLNHDFKVVRYISLRDNTTSKPPEHLPEDLERVFREAAACLSIGCFNAAATMFRLCIDLATYPLLPSPDDKTVNKPNSRQRRNLGLRLPWLFENNLLPSELSDLAASVREDGNDGAHIGNLTQEDAEDILDFTRLLLERLYSSPERVQLAKKRREERRASRPA